MGPPWLKSSHGVKLINSLLVLLTQLCQGSKNFTMISNGDVLVVDPTERITLGCEFTFQGPFDLFDNPVLWRKYQLHENTQMNLMGSILRPFEATGRFDVKFSDNLKPRYRLEMTINEVIESDSGNYTCEVRAPGSTLLGQTTYHVYVRASIKSMSLTSDNGTSISRDIQPRGIATLTVVERRLVNVHCLVKGGYPPPKVDVFLNQKDRSDAFQFSHSAELTGAKGYRTIVYHTQRISQSFTALADDDGKRLKCIAAVAGIKSNVSFVLLKVLYKPRIQCQRSTATVGATAVDVKCEITAKPPVIHLWWTINKNGTTLSEVGVVSSEGFWIKRIELSNGVTETRLYLREVKDRMFRKYTLKAQNEVGETTEEVELFRKPPSSKRTEPVGRRSRIGKKDLAPYRLNTATSHFAGATFSMLVMSIVIQNTLSSI